MIRPVFLFAIAAVLARTPYARALSYSPPQQLLTSPALLLNYLSWDQADRAFSVPDSETRSYRDLVQIAYDDEIQRPWGDAYFPEAQQRLAAFRAKVCPNLKNPALGACAQPSKMETSSDVAALEGALKDPKLLQALNERWNYSIKPVQFVNNPVNFDLIANPQNLGAQDSASETFWDMKPQVVSWDSVVPIMDDVGTYLAGFSMSEDFAGQFALSSDGVILNDWQIRLVSMQFAHDWKFSVETYAGKKLNAVTQGEDLEYRTLSAEHKSDLDTTYQKLLELVQDNEEAQKRFLSERKNSNYPEEVYQHVAYDLLSALARMESAYYRMATDQKPLISPRQKSLEALLTLQHYAPDTRIFLVEIETLSGMLTAHAAILNQTATLEAVSTFTYEHLRAILGTDEYTDDNFARFGYALLDDDLMDHYFLHANHPEIDKELHKPDGTHVHLKDLSPRDQVRILRAYAVGPKGEPSLSGSARLGSAMRAHMHLEDLQELAGIIHQAHPNENAFVSISK